MYVILQDIFIDFIIELDIGYIQTRNTMPLCMSNIIDIVLLDVIRIIKKNTEMSKISRTNSIYKHLSLIWTITLHV